MTLLNQSLAWALYDARAVAYLGLLHWATGTPFPGIYRGPR